MVDAEEDESVLAGQLGKYLSNLHGYQKGFVNIFINLIFSFISNIVYQTKTMWNGIQVVQHVSFPSATCCSIFHMQFQFISIVCADDHWQPTIGRHNTDLLQMWCDVTWHDTTRDTTRHDIIWYICPIIYIYISRPGQEVLSVVWKNVQHWYIYIYLWMLQLKLWIKRNNNVRTAVIVHW